RVSYHILHHASFQFSSTATAPPHIYTLSLHDALPISFTLESVRHGASCHNSLLANAVPAITAARQPRTLPPMYSPAYQYSPSPRDRKSTRLNSSHVSISYAVFCLKKKTA